MFRNSKQRDYQYRNKIFDKEDIRFGLEGVGLIILLAFFFYRSLWVMPCMLPILTVYCRERKKEYRRKQQKETAIQFKDAILSVSANQKAGYSVENAFRQAYGDMLLLYGKDSIICRELKLIEIGLSNNVTLEKLLYDFGKKSKAEDIVEFAGVFAAAKRNGGNMTEIIERTVSVIEEKIEMEKEIHLILSAKRMEQKIMNIVPFAILIYVGITSKGFFDALYHNGAGVVIMTVCLAVYGSAVWMSRKIVDIEI